MILAIRWRLGDISVFTRVYIAMACTSMTYEVNLGRKVVGMRVVL
jgi:hypothetical protein